MRRWHVSNMICFCIFQMCKSKKDNNIAILHHKDKQKAIGDIQFLHSYNYFFKP